MALICRDDDHTVAVVSSARVGGLEPVHVQVPGGEWGGVQVSSSAGSAEVSAGADGSGQVTEAFGSTGPAGQIAAAVDLAGSADPFVDVDGELAKLGAEGYGPLRTPVAGGGQSRVGRSFTNAGSRDRAVVPLPGST